MKTVLIPFLLWLGCHFLQAQSLNDSVLVTCDYKSDTKEIIVNIHNGTSMAFYLTQYLSAPMLFVGTQVAIHHQRCGEIYSSALCRSVDGKYQEPQKVYKMEPGERVELRTRLERFKIGDLLNITVQLCGFFDSVKIPDLDESSYRYTKKFDVRF